MTSFLTGKESRDNLLSAIRYLEEEGCDNVVFELLAAIANSVMWSEEADKRFRECGFAAAIELYDGVNTNTPSEVTQEDPNNPRNWTAYKEFVQTLEEEPYSDDTSLDGDVAQDIYPVCLPFSGALETAF